jgi:predicted cupin superfamily sugar epimerase
MSSASTTPDLESNTAGSSVAAFCSDDPVIRMKNIIERFNLIKLPLEGGLFQIIDRSSLPISLPSRPLDSTLHAQSHIYYMLTYLRPNEPHLAYNYLHSIDDGDDLHILVEGDSVDYYLFYKDGHVEHKILGHDYAAGEVPVVTTPGTIASKALKLRHGKNGFAFIVSVIAPEWSPDRCRIGAGQSFLDMYVGKEEWCTKEFLKELIGPNWIANNNTTDNRQP